MNERKNAPLRDLKRLASGQLIGKYGIAILAILIVSFVNYLAFMIELRVLGNSTSTYVIGLLVELIVDLLFGIIVYGQSVFFLNLARNKEPLSASLVFSGFKGLSDKAILIQSVFTGFTFLGTIPSILLHFGVVRVPEKYDLIFSYGVLGLQMIIMFFAKLYFGQAFFVLADNPNLSAGEILKKSLELMKNKKGRLFLIYLSSLPLALISVFACCIGYLWFAVYFETLRAYFYLDLIGEDPKAPFSTTAGPSDGSTTLDIHL